MAFVATNYETDGGEIMRIRISEATVSAAGAAPAGPVQVPGFVKISKTSREFGVRPRLIVLSRKVGNGDSASTKYKRVPVLTKAEFDDYSLGQAVTIGAQIWEATAKLPEDY